MELPEAMQKSVDDKADFIREVIMDSGLDADMPQWTLAFMDVLGQTFASCPAHLRDKAMDVANKYLALRLTYYIEFHKQTDPDLN